MFGSVCTSSKQNSHIFRHVNITLTSITLNQFDVSNHWLLNSTVCSTGDRSVTDGVYSQKASNAASVGPMLVQRWQTTIGITLCQRWPNVSAPTLRRCWHNVGVQPLGQRWANWQIHVGPTLVSRRWPNVRVDVGPTLGQRRNASWVAIRVFKKNAHEAREDMIIN